MINGLRNSGTANYKMMKRVLLLFALALFTQGLHAQDKTWGETATDSVRCWENYNNFGALFNQKQYAQAYENWNVVYETCPAAKEVIYIYGARVIEAKIEEVETKAEAAAAAEKVTLMDQRNELVSQLFEMYDNRMKYFPGKEAYVKASKAADLFEYYGDSATQQVFDLFGEAMELDATELSASHFWTYFMTAVELKKQDKIDLAGVFDIYNIIDENIAKNTDELNIAITSADAALLAGTLDDRGQRTLQRNKALLENYEKVKGNVEKSLRKFLTSCETIARVYNAETFAENRENEVWIRRAVRTLGAEYVNDSGEVVSCRDNPLYFEMTEALYQMNPSTEAARNMGRLALVRKEYEKAIDYFSQSIEGEVDPMNKADDNLKRAYALQKLGRLPAAKSAIMEAIRLNPNSGQAHLQLSTVYAAADGICGSNAVEKQAVYWAAIDRANTAARLDPTLRNKANQAISAYRRGVVSKDIAFRLNVKEGDSISIGCWINETVTVRFY